MIVQVHGSGGSLASLPVRVTGRSSPSGIVLFSYPAFLFRPKTPTRSQGDQRFESHSLQRGVCKMQPNAWTPATLRRVKIF